MNKEKIQNNIPIKKISPKSSTGRLRRVLVALGIVTGVVIVFCIVTFFTAPFFMVNPHFDKEAHKQVLSLPDAQPVIVPIGTNPGELSGWLLDRNDEDGLIIFFGGINDTAAESICLFNDIGNDGFFINYDIAIVDWPGYGENDGAATDDSLRLTAADVVNYFTVGNAPGDNPAESLPEGAEETATGRQNKIIVMGYSMGTGPAVYAASLCDPDALVLIAPYHSSADLYNSVVNIFHGPLKRLLSYEMNTYDYAAEVDCPSLVIAGKDDERVPFESSYKLAMLLKNCKMTELSGISHGELLSSEPALISLAEFLAEQGK
ncbi:MAG: alpha/beta hydrolase [Lachnospiraceae bacterium]|jgi:pimeloyl-ACP methyl ester carboxylesterase